jgi:leucyl-tRNA synthetase/very-short-patch-repair endonuclease
MDYNFSEIERKWQQRWKENETYAVTEKADSPKYYVLDMFPYPSGAGLHVGHPLGYIASDIIARYKRNRGFNVLHPMGYDSFGLPAEQYAIQTGQHPEITTQTNIARYRQQLDRIGFAYDWNREVRTSDPEYYQWTQWIFGQIFNAWFNKDTNRAEHIDTLIEKFNANGTYGVNAAQDANWYENLPKEKFFFGNHFEGEFTATDWKSMNEEQQQLILMHYRLAYLADSVVNWCPALGTVLANDEIKDGVSERGGHPVEQKKMRQWSMRISAYAERLLQGLDTIDWNESIKEVQRNWIGRSEGASVQFAVDGHDAHIEVFTTRPDTIFGVSFMTLAPEHELAARITTDEYRDTVNAYVEAAKLKTERDRQSEVKNISGQFTGAYALHPFTGDKIPVWIGDYVLAGYGTGAVMAVPCGDQRDYDFAKKFALPIPNIFRDTDISEKAEASKDAVLAQSHMLDGHSYKSAMPIIIAELEKLGVGKGKINFRMRDAVFSRQRYWGEPFPIYYEGEIPRLISDDELPVALPEVDKYLPTESGEPPLARAVWGYTPHPQPLSKGEGSASSLADEARPSATAEHSETYSLSAEDDIHDKVRNWQTAHKATWSKFKEFGRSNRKNPTQAEDIMWQNLRNKKLGVIFRRQHSIGEFIVDFVCLHKKLVIEIDGGYHDEQEQKEYDEVRTVYLGFFGFRVIRFTNEEVIKGLSTVLKTISKNLNLENTEGPTPLSPGEGSGVRQFRFDFNTMPGWAGSSWYFLRYMDPRNSKAFADRSKIDYWNQVDLYMGGAEHATGHLLYSRFWTKILFDLGYIGFDEPFKKMINQGMILGRSNHVYRIMGTNTFVTAELKDQYETQQLYVDIHIVDNDILDTEAFKNWLPEYADAEFILNEKGQYTCTWAIDKMSKRWFNVDNPDELCEKYGADTLRLYEMFLGPVEQSKPWDTKSINGVHNFLRKLWRLFHDQDNNLQINNESASKEELKTLHKTIKKITEDLDRYSWNTCVSGFMICVNELQDLKCNKREVLEPLLILLSPFSPHIAEELWEKLGHANSITEVEWPLFDESKMKDDSFDYPVSFNGKTRYFLPLGVELSGADVEAAVRANEQTARYLEGKEIKKIIVVPKRIVNVVV